MANGDGENGRGGAADRAAAAEVQAAVTIQKALRTVWVAREQAALDSISNAKIRVEEHAHKIRRNKF